MIRVKNRKKRPNTDHGKGPEPGTEKEAIPGPKKIILRKHFSDHPGTENRPPEKY